MDLTRFIDFKEELKKGLESVLDKSSIERAIRDGHAKRRPRPCGMTIHTGIGCPLACLYCYIYDMGFPPSITPYPLSGLELLYALVVNPYVALGPGGTLMAIGSVTEPFLPETRVKALEYVQALSRLGNPIQISSKTTLSNGDIEVLRQSGKTLNFLVTIVCLRNYERLEPKAPDPFSRIETMRRLVRAGISTTLFLRPIIPGFSDKDAEDLLNLVLGAGVRTVVLGTLRITKGIYARLKAIGVPLNGRLPRPPERLSKEQLPIKARDLKEKIAKIAERLGFRVYEAACGANIESAGLACWACKWGPCGDINRLPSVSERDIAEFLKRLGYEGKAERISDRQVMVKLERGDKDVVKCLLRELCRREVIVK